MALAAAEAREWGEWGGGIHTGATKRGPWNPRVLGGALVVPHLGPSGLGIDGEGSPSGLPQSQKQESEGMGL